MTWIHNGKHLRKIEVQQNFYINTNHREYQVGISMLGSGYNSLDSTRNKNDTQVRNFNEATQDFERP